VCQQICGGKTLGIDSKCTGIKLGWKDLKDWWRDWKWGHVTTFTKYKFKLGNKWLCTPLILKCLLDNIWRVKNKQKTYPFRLWNMLKVILEPKKVTFIKFLTMGGLLVMKKLSYLGVLTHVSHGVGVLMRL
jgi:hypothetical protein